MPHLTDAAVRKYKKGNKRRRIRDTGARSLFLIIETSGHKSWQMRFRVGGRIGKITLGPFNAEGRALEGEPQIGQPLTLADAHTLAAKVLRERSLGHDPIADHKASKHRQRAEIEERGVNTFAGAVRAYIDEYARPKTRQWAETARVLGLAYDKGGGEPTVIKGGLVQRWGDKPVQDIDGHDIWLVTDEAKRVGVPGLERRTEGLSAARARAVFVSLSGLLSWCKRERRIKVNPCAGESRPPAPAARDRVLSNDEIRWFWQATQTIGEPFTSIYRLLLLLGQRLNEVACMTDDELSADGATWNLAGNRTKNGRAHVVPLPPLARAIIAGVKRKPNASLVFTTNGHTAPSGWSRATNRLRAGMLALAQQERGADAVVQAFVLHDARRTFVTGLVELGVPPHVVELVVNHISGSKAGVAGTYNRSEMLPERKAALERWSAHVAGLVSGGTDNVVSLPARQGLPA